MQEILTNQTKQYRNNKGVLYQEKGKLVYPYHGWVVVLIRKFDGFRWGAGENGVWQAEKNLAQPDRGN